MQFVQVECNYPNWNIARHENIVLSASDNAVATLGYKKQELFQGTCVSKL